MAKYLQIYHSTKGLLFTLAMAFVLHIFFVNMPPKSMHLWRQSHTVAVARNFYEEGMNIFHPRVDNRFDTDGVTGSHFPSFEYGLACVYQLTGEHYWVQRVYCLLFHLFGIWGMFLLARELTSNTLYANFAAWVYAWSPLLFYYGITALPDNLALPFSVWGVYAFLVWFETWAIERNANPWSIAGAFFFITLAGLTKLQYLALGFFLLVHVWMHRERLKWPHWAAFSFLGAFSSGVTIAWYLHAREMIEKSGLKDFGLGFKPETDVAKGLKTILSNLTSSLPESILNYSSFVLLLVGLFFFFRQKGNASIRFPLFAWSGVFVVYHLIELRQMEDHDYYMMPYLPLLSIGAAFGAWKAATKFPMALVLVLLISQPILAFVRIVPTRFLKEETEEKQVLYNTVSREKLSDCVPDKALCIVGPDDSRCIYFYFLHKKGFGFGEEGLTADQLKEYIQKGAKFLYISRNELAMQEYFKPYLANLVCNEGNFYVYSLKLPLE